MTAAFFSISTIARSCASQACPSAVLIPPRVNVLRTLLNWLSQGNQAPVGPVGGGMGAVSPFTQSGSTGSATWGVRGWKAVKAASQTTARAAQRPARARSASLEHI